MNDLKGFWRIRRPADSTDRYVVEFEETTYEMNGNASDPTFALIDSDFYPNLMTNLNDTGIIKQPLDHSYYSTVYGKAEDARNHSTTPSYFIIHSPDGNYTECYAYRGFYPVRRVYKDATGKFVREQGHISVSMDFDDAYYRVYNDNQGKQITAEEFETYWQL